MSKRHKKFRKLNPNYRNKHRKNNYIKSRPYNGKHKVWRKWEILLITLPEKNKKPTDSFLSKMLNRSVQAIQQKRYKIKYAL